MNFDEIKAKMASEPYLSARDNDDPLSCKTKSDWLLVDHAEGWPFWGTIGFDGTNKEKRVDLFFLSSTGMGIFGYTEKYPSSTRETGLKVMKMDVDIRYLEPLSTDEAERRADEITSHKYELDELFDSLE